MVVVVLLGVAVGAGDGGAVGPGTATGRLLGLAGDGRSFGDGQGQTAELATASDADAPGELGLVP
jgi:hypothetical protein